MSSSKDSTILVVDACTPSVQVLLLQDNAVKSSYESQDQSVKAIYAGVQAVCSEGIESLSGIAYCHGPGSVLGIRMAAMALNAWKTLYGLKLYAYSSFDAAHIILQKPATLAYVAGPDAFLLSDRVGHAHESTIDALKQESKDLFVLPSLKKIKALDALNAQQVEYSIKPIASQLTSIMQEVDFADMYPVNEANYKKWDGKRHKA